MNNFFNLFHYQFMQHALIAGVIIALLSGIVGYFIMVRQMGFAAHALGHISFTGACAAVLVGVSPLIGQFIMTLIAGLFMGRLANRLVKNDIVISLILGLSLGCGALCLHLYHSYAGEANVILFGNLLGVSVTDLKIIAMMAVLTLVALGVIARPLWCMTINPSLAEAKGISVANNNIIFFAITASVIALASQIAGVLLVFILVMGPPAIALQWTKSLWQGILFSSLISVALIMLGLSLSYWNDWPVSFWISVLIFLAYIIGFIKN